MRQQEDRKRERGMHTQWLRESKIERASRPCKSKLTGENHDEGNEEMCTRI